MMTVTIAAVTAEIKQQSVCPSTCHLPILAFSEPVSNRKAWTMVHVMNALCNVRYWDCEWNELESLAIMQTTIEHATVLLAHFQRYGHAFRHHHAPYVKVESAAITVEMEVAYDKGSKARG
jgi:hypothetical protein